MDAERDLRVQTVCLLILTILATGAALYWLRPVMIPFVLSLFLTLAVSPLVTLLTERARLPRGIAVFATLLLALTGLSLLGALVSASVGQLVANREAYQQNLVGLFDRISAALPLERFGLVEADVLQRIQEIPVSAVGALLVGTTNAVVDVLSQSALVSIFMVFLLLGGDTAARPATGTWREIEDRIERYLVTKAALSAATGVLVGVILAMLGIDLALVFGLFAFLLNFIPSVGSVIATLLPLPVVIMSPGISLPVAVMAIAIPGAVQFGIGNVLEPRLMGRSLDLHPVVILLALMFWGMLWGVVGMLLAAPITAMAKILFEKLDLTRPLAEVLAGRLDSIRGG